MTDTDIVAAVLAREGGFVDNPADTGGPTNMGVTLAALFAWRKRPVTIADLKALTRQEAAAIYQKRYIVAPGFDAISNPAMRALVVDSGVNHGPEDAVRFMQRALGGLKVDGVFGPLTRAAVNAAAPLRLYVRTCAERMREYGRLITARPADSVFAAGWSDRVADFLDVAPF